MADDRSLGELLYETREAKRISLREVARRSQISAPFLSDVEHGRRRQEARGAHPESKRGAKPRPVPPKRAHPREGEQKEECEGCPPHAEPGDALPNEKRITHGKCDLECIGKKASRGGRAG